jgi:aromatic-L-amino-acid/L-tryptophan decarboxylase
MKPADFRNYAHQMADYMADYLENIEQYPVKSQVKPGDILKQLPSMPPLEGVQMEEIMKDFEQIILPGISHWQSPNFFAYFPANSSHPSLLAEMLTATLAAQCMKWDTSPAAAELEENTLNWLKEMTGLPLSLHGVIQDSASTSTLVAILTARERASCFMVNDEGFTGNHYRVYCSTEAHSSIERAVKISGLGKNNLVKIPIDYEFRMNPNMLSMAIDNDLREGKQPLCVVAALGTTGCTAIDPLKEIAEICAHYNIWLHVDAAYAGSALLLPEYRWMLDGIERVDSFVFNPHKWLFTNFDCSAYFVKDKASLLNTFSILPEYLRTANAGIVNDYCDWGVPLGRRFRALKLWFVIRSYGLKGLQERLRAQISLANEFKSWIEQDEHFEMLSPLTLNLVCFRYNPGNCTNEELNMLNEKLLHALNSSGKLYISHTKLHSNYTLRMCIAQTNVERRHIVQAWELIKTSASMLRQ